MEKCARFAFVGRCSHRENRVPRTRQSLVQYLGVARGVHLGEPVMDEAAVEMIWGTCVDRDGNGFINVSPREGGLGETFETLREADVDDDELLGHGFITAVSPRVPGHGGQEADGYGHGGGTCSGLQKSSFLGFWSPEHGPCHQGRVGRVLVHRHRTDVGRLPN